MWQLIRSSKKCMTLRISNLQKRNRRLVEISLLLANYVLLAAIYWYIKKYQKKKIEGGI
jgi:hypothetical protein